MFSTILQEQLGLTHDASFLAGGLIFDKFWANVRSRTRREVERLFHMPEPLTVCLQSCMCDFEQPLISFM